MDMGRKLTVLWNEGELGSSVMLSTCFCCRAVLPNVPYRLNAQFGHLVLLIKVSVNIFNVLKSGSIWKACKCAEMFVLWLNR